MTKEELTDSERRIWDSRESGEPVDLRSGDLDRDDPARKDEWSADRTIRASVLHQLLVTPPVGGNLPPRRLDVRDARVAGRLDLADASLVCPASFVGCVFDEDFVLTNARVSRLSLSGSSVPMVLADGLSTAGDLRIDDGFMCPGGVSLGGAQVGRNLDCDGAQLGSGDGAALQGDGLTVSGDMRCARGFAANGEVRLIDASVRGQLNCTGATFAKSGSMAVVGDRMSVQGGLHISHANIDGELRLAGADIGGALVATGARITNSAGPALTGDRLVVRGSALLDQGLEVVGATRLANAHILGQLNCFAGTFTHQPGPALIADGLRVDSDAGLGRGFRAEGGARLVGARVGGQLLCDGASFLGNAAPALTADGVVVEQDAMLGPDCVAEGEVRLIGASIGGQLRFEGTFTNAESRAISADGVETRGGLFFGPNLQVTGEVRLLVAHIHLMLACEGGHLSNPSGLALAADGVVVEGSLIFAGAVTVEGEIRLLGADVTGQVAFRDCALRASGTAVDLERVTVKGPLYMRPRALEGALDLTHATAAAYYDDRRTWPSAIRLDGLVYDTIRAAPPITTDERVRWVASNVSGYSPQPYEQLAATLRQAGSEDDARRVAIAKRRARRRQLPWPGKAWDWLLDAAVGYGYRTWRALLYLGALLVIGSFAMSYAHPEHVTATKPESQISEFQPIVYAADALIPVVNLHQRDVWAAHDFAIWIAATLTLAGWVLTTAVVAALTGLLRRD